ACTVFAARGRRAEEIAVGIHYQTPHGIFAIGATGLHAERMQRLQRQSVQREDGSSTFVIFVERAAAAGSGRSVQRAERIDDQASFGVSAVIAVRYGAKIIGDTVSRFVSVWRNLEPRAAAALSVQTATGANAVEIACRVLQ